MSDAPAPCSCPLAGYCERHQREKYPHLHKLCQTREDYRAAWDAKAKGEPYVPTLAQQLINVSKSAAKWIKAGRPRRSPEAIAELFVICQGCEFYVTKGDGVGKCGACGCWLKKNGGMMNKLEWATEACPRSKWQATVQLDPMPADHPHSQPSSQ